MKNFSEQLSFQTRAIQIVETIWPSTQDLNFEGVCVDTDRSLSVLFWESLGHGERNEHAYVLDTTAFEMGEEQLEMLRDIMPEGNEQVQHFATRHSAILQQMEADRKRYEEAKKKFGM